MNQQQAEEILEKYKEGTASVEEVSLLQDWAMAYTEDAQNELSIAERIAAVDNIWQNLDQDINPSRTRKLWPRITIAAMLICIGSIASYFIFYKSAPNVSLETASKHILPGKNQATLTLANGRKIVLAASGSSQLLDESGMTIHKTKDGELIYTVKENAVTANDSSKTNVLETAKGQQYQLVLPDGTHVWLNATSSIKYPLVFSAGRRIVELQGEAYFEVAHRVNQPFLVSTAKQKVEVIGTHFNINSYPEESLSKITLLQGSIKVNTASIPIASGGQLLLKPGEQSVFYANQVSIVQANLEEAVAWKNGLFQFEAEDIESIMRKVARWYNVDIQYQGEISQEKFSGILNRFDTVAPLLKRLSLTGKVHFTVEGRRITVTK
jgi:transmembrane sensor